MSYSSTPLPDGYADSDDRERGDVIVLADASVEGEDIASILRARGFIVFDVPLALLESRVSTEEPKVILVDVDQPGAIEKIQRLRQSGPGGRAHIFCLGDPLRAAELDISLTDNVFERPVDAQRLLDRAVAVANPAATGFARGTTPPPMFPARPSAMPPPESIPPISDFPRAQDPLEVGSFLDEGDPATSLGALAGGNVRLSPELAQQIFAAEERIRGDADRHSSSPASDDLADCAVPAELLAQLDEPLDAIDDLEGTGGLAAALAHAGGSSGGSSVSVGPGAMTPAPRIPGGTGITPVPDPFSIPRAKPSSPEPAIDTNAGFDANVAQPSGTSVGALSQRGGTPAMGIKLGELLGLRPEDAKRPDTATRGPASQATGSTTNTNPFESFTQRGDDALAGFTADAASLSPLSPPVRFQEPRDIAQGRAVFDLRTIPPQGPLGRVGERLLGREAPIVIPPSGPAPVTPPRPITDRDEGVSPAAASVHPPPRAAETRDAPLGAVFGEGEGFRPLARAVATRTTGSLCLTAPQGIRRLVLSDGDLVTASSDIADESLIAFLAGRGDLDRDAAARLAGKLPPSGRHAGAALIAQGFLAQGDLWPVLRAHAEWLLGKIVVSGPGSSELEDDIPGRLKAEPSVFGGATGAEVFLETCRRVLDPARSLGTLHEASRLDVGPRMSLLAECALSGEEEQRVRSAAGKTVAEVCAGQAAEFASAIRALVELEVLTLLPAAKPKADDRQASFDPIDEEAIRKKVQAKMTLVQEGDYFSLLGVIRGATSYEIKRAFLELRRTFEPRRLLTAQTADLYDDVALIVEVIEEAYDILKDDRRRERYRRAIEAAPE